MMFGIFLYYLGLIFSIGSAFGFLIVFIFMALFIMYIKFVEEKELELRFSEEYIKYKENTPFLIPRPKKR